MPPECFVNKNLDEHRKDDVRQKVINKLADCRTPNIEFNNPLFLASLNFLSG